MSRPLALVGRWWSGVRPRRADLKADVLAGLPNAISSVPDGMASATLVGVSPAYGLYATFAGPTFGGLSASTRMMVVTTTTAASLAAGSALASVPDDDRAGALVVLTMAAGIVMLVAGLLRLGRYVRFVSRSVMLGFLSGVAVNISLGQVPDLLGASTDQSINLTKAIDVLLHPSGIDWPTATVGLSALAILVLLNRTRFALWSSLAAVTIPTVAALLLNADSVQLIADSGAIPSGLPPLAFPRLSDVTPQVLSGALAVAVIVLVQGAGVAEAAPNKGDVPADTNADFVAQGVANVASSLVHGIPVGGSVSGTALNVSLKARSRWASVFAGLWMLLILVALSGVVSQVASATLAAVLIVVGLGTLAPAEIATVWRTGSTAKIAMTVTFVATLLLPVAAAVAIGLITSLVLQLNREAMDLSVVELRVEHGGRFVQATAPGTLPSHAVTVLDVYGSLLYAGARTLQARLPSAVGSVSPVVVLRLRGRTTLGATFFAVVTTYSNQLAERNGTLYLSGVDPEMLQRFQRSYSQDARGNLHVFEATEVVGDSTLRAVSEARAWLVQHRDPPVGDEDGS
ncbi:SulP family inorganic anion transporter [Angustibacter luteus]|uniref:SulP family inorganic anion transporter n=1 Tax=Angustibacter luteus TaxID=658456 RepID=A0ABW1JDH7_9ACTN